MPAIVLVGKAAVHDDHVVVEIGVQSLEQARHGRTADHFEVTVAGPVCESVLPSR